eukprot:1898929-Prymnesium_polylepis.1
MHMHMSHVHMFTARAAPLSQAAQSHAQSAPKHTRKHPADPPEHLELSVVGHRPSRGRPWADALA